MISDDLSLVVGRSQGTVVVTVAGDLDGAALARLEDVLADLIDGQGNLTVAVDLTCAVAAPHALEAFVSAQQERFRGTNLTLRPPAPAEWGGTMAQR